MIKVEEIYYQYYHAIPLVFPNFFFKKIVDHDQRKLPIWSIHHSKYIFSILFYARLLIHAIYNFFLFFHYDNSIRHLKIFIEFSTSILLIF